MGVGLVRRILAATALSGAVVILAGCGGGRSISTDAGAQALRTAGFPYMRVHRHVEIATELDGEIDEVDVGVRPGTRDWVRAELMDFDSSKRAASFFNVGRAASSARICNVIFSYKAHEDPGGARRARRAERLLRVLC